MSIPKSVSKIKADGRFTSMLSDKRFQISAPVDKYGRKTQAKNELKKFYELEESPEESQTSKQGKTNKGE